jgi:MFS family permease
MLEPLANRTYRHLFLAQIVALIGTGLATVALGLLAYQLAGSDAGAVLGTALAIKMIAYVGVAPIAGAAAQLLPRRAFLVALDLIRAGVALCLPFVDQVWQVYLLIFVLQSASAAFTPTFQAMIPDVLPDEEDYTKALSLSRLAYDLEGVASPMLAAALLTVISFRGLFAGTSVGFLLSAALVVSVTLPRLKADEGAGFVERVSRGLRIYLATPRLRGLLALNLAAAAGGAIVFVNTVVIVRSLFGYGDREVAITLGVFGLGSMAAALSLPSVLDRIPDRLVMLTGAGAMAAPLIAAAFALWRLPPSIAWPAILLLWVLLGLCYGMLITPTGRVLRRSSNDEDRPTLFAAQFALSHACWLLAYSLAGRLGAAAGLPAVIVVHAGITLISVGLAARLWPTRDPEILEHEHAELETNHPHLQHHAPHSGKTHAHAYRIDTLHRQWPIAPVN